MQVVAIAFHAASVQSILDVLAPAAKMHSVCSDRLMEPEQLLPSLFSHPLPHARYSAHHTLRTPASPAALPATHAPAWLANRGARNMPVATGSMTASAQPSALAAAAAAQAWNLAMGRAAAAPAAPRPYCGLPIRAPPGRLNHQQQAVPAGAAAATGAVGPAASKPNTTRPPPPSHRIGAVNPTLADLAALGVLESAPVGRRFV